MVRFVRSQGIGVSEARVGQALCRVNPSYHNDRREATRRSLNPIPTVQIILGTKIIQIDQNEKLVMFGVTHICAIDGYSSKIVAFITSPIKNCVEIYSHLYK